MKLLLDSPRPDAGGALTSFRLRWHVLARDGVAGGVLALLTLALVVGALARDSLGELGQWAPLAGVAALLAALFGASGVRLQVGAEGLWLSRWGRRRFVAYADIASVRRGLWSRSKLGGGLSAGIDLVLRSGEVLTLATQSSVLHEEASRDVVAERIAEAMEVDRAARSGG